MTSYIKSLDGVRALAIVLVMLFHFYFALEIGWIGVQIFFVLSGYLITKILLVSKEKADFGPYLKRFYWRRTVRIFPLYYVYLFLVTIIFFFVGKPSNFGDTAGYLYTYTYNLQPLFTSFTHDAFFTHFWSLCVEEQFYLFWPLLIYFFNKKQMKVMIVCLIVFIPFFRLLFGEFLLNYGYHEAGEILYRFSFSHFDAFAWGGSIAVFALPGKVSLASQRILLVVSVVLLVGIGMIHLKTIQDSAIGLTSFGYPIGGMVNYQHVWSYTLLNFFSTTLILFLVSTDQNESGVLGKLFKHSIAIQIGKISYGMYVYHWIVLSFHKNYINPLIGNMILSFIIYFVFVFGISWISFHTLEKFFLKLKDMKFKTKKGLASL